MSSASTRSVPCAFGAIVFGGEVCQRAMLTIDEPENCSGAAEALCRTTVAIGAKTDARLLAFASAAETPLLAARGTLRPSVSRSPMASPSAAAAVRRRIVAAALAPAPSPEEGARSGWAEQPAELKCEPRLHGIPGGRRDLELNRARSLVLDDDGARGHLVAVVH